MARVSIHGVDWNWNEGDLWLLDRLYFSMKTDGGINFIAALEPSTNTLTMLPMTNQKATCLTQDAPELLSKDFRNKLYELAQPNDAWFPLKPGDMTILRSKFPMCYLKEATKVAHYGEIYKTTTHYEDGEHEDKTSYSLMNPKTRLYKGPQMIEPMTAFSNNIACYRTSKNSFNMSKLKIYSTQPTEIALKHLNLNDWCIKRRLE